MLVLWKLPERGFSSLRNQKVVASFPRSNEITLDALDCEYKEMGGDVGGEGGVVEGVGGGGVDEKEWGYKGAG